MKRFLPIILVFLLASCSLPIQPVEKPVPCPSLSVYFSPKGEATEAIVKELDNAKTSIQDQPYSLTSAAIVKAIVPAHERGVKVEIILDKSNLTAQYTSGPLHPHERGQRNVPRIFCLLNSLRVSIPECTSVVIKVDNMHFACCLIYRD